MAIFSKFINWTRKYVIQNILYNPKNLVNSYTYQIFFVYKNILSILWTYLVLTRTKWRHAWRSTRYDFISKWYYFCNKQSELLSSVCVLQINKKINRKMIKNIVEVMYIIMLQTNTRQIEIQEIEINWWLFYHCVLLGMKKGCYLF